MLLRPGDTQEVPDVGVFEWDGREFWVLEDVKYTHSQIYFLLEGMGQKFNVKSVAKEQDNGHKS